MRVPYPWQREGKQTLLGKTNPLALTGMTKGGLWTLPGFSQGPGKGWVGDPTLASSCNPSSPPGCPPHAFSLSVLLDRATFIFPFGRGLLAFHPCFF